MTDPEAVKFLELVFAWVDLREHITATIPRTNTNVTLGMIVVEKRFLDLIAEGERSTVGKDDPNHTVPQEGEQTTAIRRALRQLR